MTRHLSPEYHEEQCQRICNRYREGEFDVIYADGLAMAQYVSDSKLQCPAIIDLHDSLTLLFSRMVQAERHWLRKLLARAETQKIGRLEKVLSRRFGAILTNSKVDEAYLRSLDPSGEIVTIGNGVDSEFFTPADSKSDVTNLVFIGVMDYGPNEDAVVYFCDAILPLIQELHPEVHFWVVGKDPTDRVKMLGRRPGVHITGGVPDVRPFLESAGIFVCPLRYGAGVKNKILAALAMRKAVVATPLSLEGLHLRVEKHVIAADAPEHFASAVINLIEDPNRAAQLGQSGQAFVRTEYSWKTSSHLVESILTDLVVPV